MQTDRIIPLDLNEEMQKSFIAYAMAVIINRALPDARDGLKPVHRRIIYAMNELSLSPDKPHKKCARIVGDVLGKYHPHGDSAIYDSLVRMAQEFSTRYMLVDGHGNFGSVDGDSAAAMRYTEARMSKITMEMIRDIDKNTVDFYPNFDGTLDQPASLPCRFPNLLVNGSGGIAVGMATNIPPHNLGETISASIALLDNPEMDVEELMEFIPAPDFPTGGIISGVSGVRQAYRTGRGKVRIRAKAEIEIESDGHERIVVTEIPYQVNKEQLIGDIRMLAHEKRIEGIQEANDESDSSGMRIAIELKRGANANVVLNRLYKHTQMQTTFGVIMLALVDGEPRVLTLKQALEEYLRYQREVIVRRTQFDLERAQKRAHILEGLIRALDVIDEIIAIIRSSKDTSMARTGLMERFEFSEVQAQAILDMRLHRLTGLERERLEEEYGALMKQIQYYEDVLSKPDMVRDIIKEDLIDIKSRFSDERRTSIQHSEDEIDMDELIQEEDMVVTLTHQGYVKRISSDTYRSQRRGGKGIMGLSTKEEDFVADLFVTSTHNHLLFFTTKGKVFIKKCYEIPEAGRQAKGTAIVNLLNLAQGERISAVFPVADFKEECWLMMCTRQGVVKKTPLSDFGNIRQNGIIAVGIREGDELIGVIRTFGDNNIMIGTRLGMSINFNENDVRSMGRLATGVRGINLREGDEVIGACKIIPEKDLLIITENGYGKRVNVSEYRQQTRGGIGIKTISVTEKTGQVCSIHMVTEDEDIILISDANVIIRLAVRDVSTYSRAAQGVRLMRIDSNTRVVSAAKLPQESHDDEEIIDESMDTET